MGIFGRKEQESEQWADIYSLNRDGVDVDKGTLKGRSGRLDRPHIFEDGNGQIIPASKPRAPDGGIERYSGRTLKHGPEHSHDEEHNLHLLDNMPNPPSDLLADLKEMFKITEKIVGIVEIAKNKINPS